MSTLRRAWRLPLALALLFGGLFTVLVVFPLISQQRRDRTVAGWSRWLLGACGVRLRVVEADGAGGLDAAPGMQSAAEWQGAGGSPPPSLMAEPRSHSSGGCLIVANHVSWLDIFVIDAVMPSCFVAKDDIARWPVVGTLVARVGTMFLARGKRHAVHQAIGRIAEALREGRRIAVFPEGTSGSGEDVMPFHGNLIEAAVQAKVAIVPLALRFRGPAGESLAGSGGVIDYLETTFPQSFWRVIGAPGVVAELHPLAPLRAPEEGPANRARHVLAAQARAAIADRLQVPMADELPDEVKRLRSEAASAR